MMILPIVALLGSDLQGLRDCPAADLHLSSRLQPGDGQRIALTVRNSGHRTCLLGGLPTVTFRTRRGDRLPIAWRQPFGPGGHGPVVVPVTLRPGGEARSELSIADPDPSHRVCAARPVVVVTWSERLHRSLAFSLCYASDGSTMFDQSWFHTTTD